MKRVRCGELWLWWYCLALSIVMLVLMNIMKLILMGCRIRRMKRRNRRMRLSITMISAISLKLMIIMTVSTAMLLRAITAPGREEKPLHQKSKRKDYDSVCVDMKDKKKLRSKRKIKYRLKT